MSLPAEPMAAPDPALLALSERLLHAVKTETATDPLRATLASLSLARLRNGLTDDAARKTFWINLYNAYFQLIARSGEASGAALFAQKRVVIAGERFSLDDIEHGILRRYRWKYSLGYLPQLWPRPLIRQLAVSRIDCRIHFALNCGAVSCPPISTYIYPRLDQQLDLAAESFLRAETTIDSLYLVVGVSKLMSWYRADFGGTEGILSLTGRVLDEDLRGYALTFLPYDWSARLANFRD